MNATYWSLSGDDLVLRVKVSPNASKDAVEDIVTDADGRALLRIRVRAVAEKGKANKAVCALLAKHFDLPKTRFDVMKGSKNSMKHILITGGAELSGKLD